MIETIVTNEIHIHNEVMNKITDEAQTHEKTKES